MAAPLIPNFTVAMAMTACGIPAGPVINGMTPPERVAFDLFDNSFETCMDKSFDEVDRDFSTYAKLAAAEGKIRTVPGVAKRVKAFIQWTRDEIRMGRDPSNTPFPVMDTAVLIRRNATHKQFVTDSSQVSEAAKPKAFTKDMKYQDWEPTLVGYLRLKPGRNGVPLSYVIRPNDVPDPSPRANFLEEYIHAAPLTGDAYNIDSGTVAVILRGLTNTLNKKHNSLAYHYTRWNVAAGICILSWISGSENIADPFTKRLPEFTREYLFGNWIY